jgi:streptomycin 6-kinase
MITYTARAITWVLSRMLRIPEDAPVAHGDLEHAHWDGTRRGWFTHEDDPGTTPARAA